MYATAAFDFNQADNGWLMSEFAFMRSIFLILIFPRIINFGRHLLKRTPSSAPDDTDDSSISTTADDQLPTEPGDFDAATGEQADIEPTKPISSAGHHREVGHFDLIFLRWSLVVDGALTTVVAFATKRWHIYLGKFLLNNMSLVILRNSLQPPSSSLLALAPRQQLKVSSQTCAQSRIVRMLLMP